VKRSIRSLVLRAAKALARQLARVLYRVLAALSRIERRMETPPRRILVLNGGHIGDVVISTAVVGAIRKVFPEAEIGFVTGGWSLPVVEANPAIEAAYCVDHWALNRAKTPIWRKYLRYRSTRRRAIISISNKSYDLALCIYPHFLADMLDVAWKSRIPRRIAFRFSLRASLATDLVDFLQSPFVTQSEVQMEVLRPLGFSPSQFRWTRPMLPESSPQHRAEVARILGGENLESFSYVVIHMGSGANNRELPVSFWREVASRIPPSWIVLFTGKGMRERANIQAAIAGLNHCIDASDQLSWGGFVAAVRHAEMLFGVESMAGHVAAAVGTASRLVYTGSMGVARWRPQSERSLVFTNHVPCAPCRKIEGCAAMSCLGGVPPAELVADLLQRTS
jgi:ADP-heptose:LPS heptosyltransferase